MIEATENSEKTELHHVMHIVDSSVGDSLVPVLWDRNLGSDNVAVKSDNFEELQLEQVEHNVRVFAMGPDTSRPG